MYNWITLLYTWNSHNIINQLLESSSGEGHGNPLQYSCLENSMDRKAWQATVCGVARVRHDWAANTHNRHAAAAAAKSLQSCLTV